MSEDNEAKYIVKCIACQKDFRVPSMMSNVPEHKKESDKPEESSVCPGSNMQGSLIGPVAE